MNNPWDCIIVGGGAAGLSAALVLGRARRRTLLVDAGEQSNRMAEGIGGLLDHDRRPPEALYRAGRASPCSRTATPTSAPVTSIACSRRGWSWKNASSARCWEVRDRPLGVLD